MTEAAISERLSRIWVIILMRGIAPIIFGAVMLFRPNDPPTFYALLFGAYVFIDGVLLLLQTFIAGKSDKKRGPRMLHSIIGVLAGLAVFLIPGISGMRLVTLFSGYEVTTGILQSLTALDLRNITESNDLVLLGGVISVVVGGLLYIRPMDTPGDLIRAIGIFLMIYGMILASVSLKFKKSLLV